MSERRRGTSREVLLRLRCVSWGPRGRRWVIDLGPTEVVDLVMFGGEGGVSYTGI